MFGAVVAIHLAIVIMPIAIMLSIGRVNGLFFVSIFFGLKGIFTGIDHAGKILKKSAISLKKNCIEKGLLLLWGATILGFLGGVILGFMIIKNTDDLFLLMFVYTMIGISGFLETAGLVAVVVGWIMLEDPAILQEWERKKQEEQKLRLQELRNKAEQGDAGAQWYLSTCYYNGTSVPQDKEEAVKWCRKAAEQGHVHGQYALGLLYYIGEIVPQDKDEAAKWYRKAAEQGLEEAQKELQKIFGK